MCSTMALNKEKYEEAILYLCANLGGEVRGKKKLAKLLYFVDFDLFEKTEQSLTGDIYKALPMGPFPQAMEGIALELCTNKSISIDTTQEYQGYIPTEVYKCVRAPNANVFNTEEKNMLDRVIMKYGHLNGKQLEDLTHAEAPYLGTELSKEIAYELSFYRGTDFAE